MRAVGGEERARLWLHYACEYNVRLFLRIAKQAASLTALKAAYDQSDPLFAGLPERVRSRLREAAAPGFLDRFLETLEQKRIDFTFPGDARYPRLLGEIPDPPSVLYYKGSLLPDPALSIAVVGSRHATKYGVEAARRFAGELAAAGALIVSGMAEGIDAVAARAALESSALSCATVAVLGCGADVVYPRANEALYDEIAERGAVVSEFLPGAHADRFHFPIRNRVMSGMSHGTLVVEAAERSGTSITAGYAHDQGREVFAVPGRISDAMSAGPNGMIARGEAKPVFCLEDILSEFTCLHVAAEPKPEGKPVSASALTCEQQRICRALQSGEMNFDELCETLALPVGTLNSCLTELQFLGIMKQLPGRWYALDACVTLIWDD